MPSGMIVHMTSAHPAFDVRIFYKECRTLAQAGYEVTLIAPHDRDELADGVWIKAVPRPKSRAERLTRTVWQVFREAARQPASVYHFHDPELLVAAAILKIIKGRAVIFDVHEDYPLVALRREWIPRPIRFLAFTGVWLGLRILLPFFDAVVAATDSIALSLPHSRTVTVRNFADMPTEAAEGTREGNLLIYAGSVMREMGVHYFLDAFVRMSQRLPVRLRLIGAAPYSNSFEEELQRCPPETVEVLPRMRHEDALRMMVGGTLGLCLNLPLPGSDGLPTKLFEYMAMGLPVVGADLPTIRKIIEDTGCGIVVDFRNPQEVADQIVELLQNPGALEQMRRKGREAFARTYQWRTQAPALLKLYEELTAETRQRDVVAASLSPRR